MWLLESWTFEFQETWEFPEKFVRKTESWGLVHVEHKRKQPVCVKNFQGDPSD